MRQHRWLKPHVNSSIGQSHPADTGAAHAPEPASSPLAWRGQGRPSPQQTAHCSHPCPSNTTLRGQAVQCRRPTLPFFPPLAQGSLDEQSPSAGSALLSSLPQEAISSLIFGFLYHERKIKGDKDPRLHNFPSAVCRQHTGWAGSAWYLEDHLGPRYLMILRHLKI